MATYATTFSLQVIYVYRINDAAHKGCLKIGQVTADGVSPGAAPNSPELKELAGARIRRQTLTAGVEYELLHAELAIAPAKRGQMRCFNDKEVHDVLLRSGVRRKRFAVGGHAATEWFATDLATVRRAIAAAKEGRKSLAPGEVTSDFSPIVFRPEQKRAIDETVRRFRRKTGKRMLWNAKMRFGKTLCALQVARELDFRRTLILTHRPVVDEGWQEDFSKIFHDRPDCFYCRKGEHGELSGLEERAARGEASYVCFASMQDLRGSQTAGGRYEKNDELFAVVWDLVIVDEAHEGTQTSLGRTVLGLVVKENTRLLQLSGTPFNLLSGTREEEVFTWDYVMEQRAKREWDEQHAGEPNPYAALPTLHVYTYDLGERLSRYRDADNVFDFREFFRTRDDDEERFAHEADVRRFLDLLSQDAPDTLYPFARQDFRDNFRHTLWMVPGVKAARALSLLLRAHPVFGMFNVANVAGAGDEEEAETDALKKVRAAMTDSPGATYSVTLSCGRLTTGVSVREWSAVLMLSGQASTSAASYMQTIFRVQTPAVVDGRMKTDCHVFDFAPDRTLRILAEAAGMATGGDHTSEARRAALEAFLTFCPVISLDGSAMRPMDAGRLMGHLKRAYVEKVVREGFESDELYSDALWKLDDKALQSFEKLRGLIGETKAMGPMGDFTLNAQGLTGKKRNAGGEGKGKKEKPGLSPEEEERRRLAANRRSAISVLRGVSVRLPLMVYGARLDDEDKPLTLERFATLVDDRSWREFMPRGVTKHKFRELARYYDEDIFSQAARRIRSLAQAADALPAEERVARIAALFSLFRNPDKETVLTPWRVVNLHLASTLGGYCFFDDAFADELPEPRPVPRGGVTTRVFAPGARVLEINSKSGLYALYVAYAKYRRRLREASAASLFRAEPSEAERRCLWLETVAYDVFVLCATPLAAAITRRTLLGFHKEAHANIAVRPTLAEEIKQNPAAAAAIVRDGDKFWKANHETHMNFEAVVGNPPYQVEGSNTRKAPVYHLFCDLAEQLAPLSTLITPGRFLFRVGQTPAEWTERTLADPHFGVVAYFQDSRAVFPSVDIKGGVAITLRDATRALGPVGFFSVFPELRSIVNKVKALGEENICSLVSSQGLYKFTEKAFEDCPHAAEVQGKGTGMKVTSNSFTGLPELFTEKPDGDDTVSVLGLYAKRRELRHIKRAYLQPNGYLDTYNVFVPEANGTGAIGEVLSTPVIGTPMTGHTDTFLSVGRFATREEAEACLKYVKTRFARTLLGTLKATQHNPRDTWANVPAQCFAPGGEIDWTLPVPAIDRQLFAKYGLSPEEVAFVEEKVRPME